MKIDGETGIPSVQPGSSGLNPRRPAN